MPGLEEMMPPNGAHDDFSDIVICGGGLAGLTLARHLRLKLPDLDVTVVESTPGPLPEACFKVGESSVEIATFYLIRELGLEDYLNRRHLPKLGLRFFLGHPRDPLERRPELGLRLFPPITTYQLDRGVLENDLRRLVVEQDVRLLEGATVEDLALAEENGYHQVAVGLADGGKRALACRWVIDALGRRRFLQTKLKLLIRDNGHRASAAWFRMKGRISIEELIPAGHRSWHRRTSEERWYSTNHLMGDGYWVWTIPLGSENTSFGIVTDENVHPFRTYATSYEQAFAWLEEHEPDLAKLLAGREPLDFKRVKDYSYGSRQVFSDKRWSCIGEAGVFLDPFYSPGSDYIAVGNTITVELIRRDLEGTLTPEVAELYNDVFLRTLYEPALAIYRGTYATFGKSHIFTAKHVWDAATYWSVPTQIFLQGILKKPQFLPELMRLSDKIVGLQQRVQQLFQDWARMAPASRPYGFFDIALLPFLQLVALDLLTKKTEQQFLADLKANLDRLEEAAQVLFFKAVEETMPDQLGRFPEPRWVHAWAISLNQERWEADGLFAPSSQPRKLLTMERKLFGGIFSPLPLGERIRASIFRMAMWPLRGRFFYFVMRLATNSLVKDKSHLIRSLFVKEQEMMPLASTKT